MARAKTVTKIKGKHANEPVEFNADLADRILKALGASKYENGTLVCVSSEDADDIITESDFAESLEELLYLSANSIPNPQAIKEVVEYIAGSSESSMIAEIFKVMMSNIAFYESSSDGYINFPALYEVIFDLAGMKNTVIKDIMSDDKFISKFSTDLFYLTVYDPCRMLKILGSAERLLDMVVFPSSVYGMEDSKDPVAEYTNIFTCITSLKEFPKLKKFIVKSVKNGSMSLLCNIVLHSVCGLGNDIVIEKFDSRLSKSFSDMRSQSSMVAFLIREEIGILYAAGKKLNIPLDMQLNGQSLIKICLTKAINMGPNAVKMFLETVFGNRVFELIKLLKSNSAEVFRELVQFMSIQTIQDASSDSWLRNLSYTLSIMKAAMESDASGELYGIVRLKPFRSNLVKTELTGKSKSRAIQDAMVESKAINALSMFENKKWMEA